MDWMSFTNSIFSAKFRKEQERFSSYRGCSPTSRTTFSTSRLYTLARSGRLEAERFSFSGCRAWAIVNLFDSSRLSHEKHACQPSAPVDDLAKVENETITMWFVRPQRLSVDLRTTLWYII